MNTTVYDLIMQVLPANNTECQILVLDTKIYAKWQCAILSTITQFEVHLKDIMTCTKYFLGGQWHNKAEVHKVVFVRLP